MLTQHGRICGAGYLVSDDIDEGGQPYVDCTDTTEDWPSLLPDLSDPATVGCLLALVRKAYDDRDAFVGRYAGYCSFETLDPMAPRVTAPTEAHCLVAALEAAP